MVVAQSKWSPVAGKDEHGSDSAQHRQQAAAAADRRRRRRNILRLQRRMRILLEQAQSKCERLKSEFELCLSSYRRMEDALRQLNHLERDLSTILRHHHGILGPTMHGPLQRVSCWRALQLDFCEQVRDDGATNLSPPGESTDDGEPSADRSTSSTGSTDGSLSSGATPNSSNLLTVNKIVALQTSLSRKRLEIQLVIKSLRSWAMEILAENIVAKLHLCRLRNRGRVLRDLLLS